SVNDKKEFLDEEDLQTLKNIFQHFIFDVFGLQSDISESNNNKPLDGLMKMILEFRNEAKTKKDFSVSDKIRDDLDKINIKINDTKDGVNWTIQE
ncbi:MAG TPA: cysteine--tRNA ligase, partial [Bacteroidia bacterium]|nr:cysteine--tRNA ligase [Bacteroidia bacterium]